MSGDRVSVVVRVVEPGAGVVSVFASKDDAYRYIERHCGDRDDLRYKYAVEEWKVQPDRVVIVPGPSGPADD